jgi:hypothetical protein
MHAVFVWASGEKLCEYTYAGHSFNCIGVHIDIGWSSSNEEGRSVVISN